MTCAVRQLQHAAITPHDLLFERSWPFQARPGATGAALGRATPSLSGFPFEDQPKLVEWQSLLRQVPWRRWRLPRAPPAVMSPLKGPSKRHRSCHLKKLPRVQVDRKCCFCCGWWCCCSASRLVGRCCSASIHHVSLRSLAQATSVVRRVRPLDDVERAQHAAPAESLPGHPLLRCPSCPRCRSGLKRLKSEWCRRRNRNRTSGSVAPVVRWRRHGAQPSFRKFPDLYFQDFAKHFCNRLRCSKRLLLTMGFMHNALV